MTNLITLSEPNNFTVTLGGNKSFPDPTNTVDGYFYKYFAGEDSLVDQVPTWKMAYKFRN